MAGYRRFTKIAFVVLNSLAALVFLLACLAPYLNPKKMVACFADRIGFCFHYCYIDCIFIVLAGVQAKVHADLCCGIGNRL